MCIYCAYSEYLRHPVATGVEGVGLRGRAEPTLKSKQGRDLMQAVVLTSPRQISIEEIAEPQLQATSDVLMRLLSLIHI